MKRTAASDKPRYSFGDVVVDCGLYSITRGGNHGRLTPRAFEVLIYLIENRDRVVEKQELFDQIWGVSFVSDNALTRMIREIRQVLGDNADAPRYIETSHRRGYRFIAELRSDSGSVSPSGGAGDRISIAVLPFVNIGGDPELEYLSEGIAESVINRLASIASVKVTPRSSAFRHRDQSESEAGRALGVQYVLSGRLLQLAGNLVVKTELIDAIDERQIWGEQFQNPVGDLFALQDEISGDISRQLKVRLAGEDPPAGDEAPDGEAYHSYLKGRYFWARRPEGTAKAIRYFERAIELEPEYADAWAGLADCYSTMGSWENEMVSPLEAVPKARAAISKAIELAPRKAEPFATLAYLQTHHDWNLVEAEKSCRRAIELNPECAGAWHWLSHLMVAAGRFDKSLSACEKMLAIDPLDVIHSNHLGWHYYHARDYRSALDRHLKTLELDPHSVWPHSELGRTYEQLGMYDQAVESFREAVRLSSISFPVSGLGHALALAGRKDEAILQIDELRNRQGYVSTFHTAIILTGLGELSRAIDLLEQACEERSGWMTYIGVDPRLDPLRTEPRFISLRRRVGF